MTTNPPPVPVIPGGKPAPLCSADCQKCAKRGLPFIAVLDTVVDHRHAQMLQEGGHSYPAAFDAGFAGMKREATRPAARLPGAGWVWVLYEDIARWDVWQTFADGSARLELQKVSADEYATQSAGLKPSSAEAVCSRGAANLGAGFFTISGAPSHASVWVAYSRHLWAPQVLRENASNAHGRRALHMTHLTPKAWIASAKLPANCLALTEANLAAHVADYGPLPAGGARTSPLVRGFENASRPLRGERLGLAAKMETQARAFEKAAGPACQNRALIVRLRDDLGVAEELNHLLQLACDLKKAWSIGGPDWNGKDSDPERAWKLTSSVHVATIEQWAVASAQAEVRQAVSRAMHKGLPPITEEDFQAGLASGRIEAGSTWSPLYVYELNGQPRRGPDGQPMEQTVASRQRPGHQTRLGRMQLPSKRVQEASAQRGRNESKSRVERYRERLDLPALTEFRSWFDGASDRWDREYLQPFDKDRIAWRETAALKSSLQVLFDPAINLCKPDTQRGTPAQQVADVAARLAAIDAVCGGGAVSAVSARHLRTLLDKPPGDPGNWFTHGLLAPFGYVQAILDDKDKQKDSAENFKGLIELPATMRQAIGAYGEKRLEESLHGVLAVRLQALQHKAAALEEKNAQALGGVAKPTPAQVLDDYKLHVRLSAVMDEVVTPHNPFMSFRVRLPLGATLDALADGMGQGQLPVELEAKTSSQRSERRQQQIKLRKLEGKPGLTHTIDYPVTLRRSELIELQRLARRRGEALVQMLPDQTLGTLSRAIELPDSVARRLVANQVTTGRQWAKAALSLDGLGSKVVFVFQLRALMDAVGKIESAEGYEYVDALMAIFSAVSGMTEVAATLGALAYQVKVEAGRTVLVRTVTTAATLRLVAGLAGAGASLFDAFASWAKASSRKARGDAAAANAYFEARDLYAISGLTLAIGSAVVWKANSTVAAEQISKSVVLRFFGTRAAALAFGSWVTGIGVLLCVGGFAWSLYAMSLEDDLNEIFLKRSHWGTKDPDSQRIEGRLPNLEAEAMAFKSLAIGVKATLEWNDNWFSADTVSAKLEIADWQEEHKLERALLFDGAAGGLTKTWDHPALTRNDAGRHEFLAVIKIPSGASGATFSYRITDSTGRVTIAGDNLKSKKD